MACAPEFASPEVARTHFDHDGTYDGGTADWWAFGIVAFELLANRQPWWDPDSEGLLATLAGMATPLTFPEGPVLCRRGEALCRELLSTTDDTFRRRCDCDLRQHEFFVGLDWDILGQGDAPDLPTDLEIQTAARFPEYSFDIIPL